MNMIGIMLILTGLLPTLSLQIQAPGTIKMQIGYKFNLFTDISLLSQIKSANNPREGYIFNQKDLMKQSPNDEELYELSISFDIKNISEVFLFNGKLIVNAKEASESEEETVYEFIDQTFQFEEQMLNGNSYLPKTFYTSDLKVELEVLITTKCKINYYPNNKCSKFCIKTENTEKCDMNGNKICQKGFYLDNYTQYCIVDWCYMTKDMCKNNGKCKNREKDFTCVCTRFYRGQFCEHYQNICETFKCPNGTTCIINGEDIRCEPNSSKKLIKQTNYSIMKLISIHSLIVFVGFLILVIISIFVTIWVCKTPKNIKNRSTETSIHSGHSYYPNNTFCKSSYPCHNCNFECYQCLGMQKPLYGNGVYMSLRSPSNRLMKTQNRAFSDIQLSNAGRGLSMIFSEAADLAMPLPPPVEEENPQCNEFML